MAISVQWDSLKFHPSAFVVHSEGREDKQVHMYKEIIPGLRGRRLRKHRKQLSGNLGIQDSRPRWTPSLKPLLLLKRKDFPPCVVNAAEFDRRIMKIPSAHRFLAVYLTLFGYLGEVYTGTVLMNSNAIKNLPGVFGSKGADTVSPSPRTSPSGSIGHKSADTLQVSLMRKRQSVRHGRR